MVNTVKKECTQNQSENVVWLLLMGKYIWFDVHLRFTSDKSVKFIDSFHKNLEGSFSLSGVISHHTTAHSITARRDQEYSYL